MSASNLQQAAQRGIDLCRIGEWEQGMLYLARVAEVDRNGSDLPDAFYSYLGYGIAKEEGRIREGIRLCKHSIKVGFYQPDNYLNLARTYILADNRRLAVQAIARGRRLDPKHPGLRELHRAMGYRRPPVFGFLTRGNPVNRFFGRLRSKMG